MLKRNEKWVKLKGLIEYVKICPGPEMVVQNFKTHSSSFCIKFVIGVIIKL